MRPSPPNLLPEAVRGLGLEFDRFERTRGGADQVRIRGGASAVGQAEIVLEANPPQAPEQRRGGDASGLAAAERATPHKWTAAYPVRGMAQVGGDPVGSAQNRPNT